MQQKMRYLAVPAVAVALATAGMGVSTAQPTTQRAVPGQTAPTQAADWSYLGRTGPAHWGKLGYPTCAKGTTQSPINITRTTSRRLADARFAYGKVSLSLVDTGHGVNVAPVGGQLPRTVKLGGIKYTFAQFHHHSPSEHQVNGMNYPAEMHFVNKAANGDLAVFGVFFKGGGATNRAWKPVIDVITQATMDPKATKARADLSTLLPKDRRSYQYRGSLTTPPCSEGVAWTVFTTPVVLSDQQLSDVMEAYQGNARPVQALNGRRVLFDTTSGHR